MDASAATLRPSTSGWIVQDLLVFGPYGGSVVKEHTSADHIRSPALQQGVHSGKRCVLSAVSAAADGNGTADPQPGGGFFFRTASARPHSGNKVGEKTGWIHHIERRGQNDAVAIAIALQIGGLEIILEHRTVGELLLPTGIAVDTAMNFFPG